MPLKFKWLMLLCVVAGALWVFTKHKQPIPATTLTTAQPIKSLAETEKQPRLDGVPVIPSPKKTKGNHANQTYRTQVLAAIEERQFSDDAYLELISLSAKVDLCRNTSLITNLFTQNQVISETRAELMALINQSCTEHQSTYPVLYTAAEEKYDLAAMFIPTSTLGSLYHQYIHALKTQQDEPQLHLMVLQEAIKAQNSSVLSHLSQIFHYGDDRSQQISDLIGSKDNSYNNEINKMALQLLACEFNQGMACEANAELMIFNCAFNSHTCGLDYRVWYRETTLPGMQRDVERVMDYYRTLGQ